MSGIKQCRYWYFITSYMCIKGTFVPVVRERPMSIKPIKYLLNRKRKLPHYWTSLCKYHIRHRFAPPRNTGNAERPPNEISSWRFIKKAAQPDDVIKWKHFPRYWPFVRGIHRSPVISAHKGKGSGALMFSLIYAWKNGWVNNGEAGDLGRHRAHYDVTVM